MRDRPLTILGGGPRRQPFRLLYNNQIPLATESSMSGYPFFSLPCALSRSPSAPFHTGHRH